MVLALTLPDGPSDARLELVTPQSSQGAVVQPVPLLSPAARALNADGTVSPIHLVLLAAPHPAGLYSFGAYIQIKSAAGAGLDYFLNWTDEVGAQSLDIAQLLGAVQIAQPPSFSLFSTGVAPITLDLVFGGAVGPPLLVDFFASIQQTGT